MSAACIPLGLNSLGPSPGESCPAACPGWPGDVARNDGRSTQSHAGVVAQMLKRYVHDILTYIRKSSFSPPTLCSSGATYSGLLIAISSSLASVGTSRISMPSLSTCTAINGRKRRCACKCLCTRAIRAGALVCVCMYRLMCVRA